MTVSDFRYTLNQILFLFPRYQWYQTDSTVIIDVFVKNIDKNSVDVKINNGNSVTVLFKTLTDAYEKTFDLAHPVKSSSFVVGSVKMEIKLGKASAEQWITLLLTDPTPNEDAPHTYPSSHIGHHDWEHIDEADEDAKDKNINTFFQSVFENAGDDGKRAMMKSFSESGGTVLSSDWNDVGGRKVEPNPPEGLRAMPK
jgi:suppressor of G2 allele of SKP1